MPNEERAAPAGGPSEYDEGEHRPSRQSAELFEAAERLERASWDRMEREHPRGGSPPREDEEDGLTGFLERQLRERPLPTLLAAVAAGWLVGKLLR